MAGEERRHAKPGGIADTEKSFKPSFKRHKIGAATVARHMFHEILREAANKIDRQHLGAERTGKLGALGDSAAIGDAELPVPIHGGRAHQIADATQQFGVWLAPRREPVDHVIEKTHALVGAGQDELGRAVPRGLLARRRQREPCDVVMTRHAVEEHKARIPSLGDHAVGTPFGLQRLGEGEQRIAASGAGDLVK